MVCARQAHRLAQEIRKRLELLAAMSDDDVHVTVIRNASTLLTDARRIERVARKHRDRLELDYSRDVGLPLEPRAEA